MELYHIEFINKHGYTVHKEFFSCENDHEAMAQADYIGANIDYDFEEIRITHIMED